MIILLKLQLSEKVLNTMHIEYATMHTKQWIQVLEICILEDPLVPYPCRNHGPDFVLHVTYFHRKLIGIYTFHHHVRAFLGSTSDAITTGFESHSICIYYFNLCLMQCKIPTCAANPMYSAVYRMDDYTTLKLCMNILKTVFYRQFVVL